MFQLLLAVSDWVDHFCNRYFYSKTQTMEFDGTGSTRLLIPDLVSLTSLKEDSTDDQSFNETWAAGDYRLEPYNGEPEQHWGEPHTSIRVRQHGAKTTFSSGEQRFQIAGVGAIVNIKRTVAQTSTTLQWRPQKSLSRLTTGLSSLLDRRL